ncbi:LPS export ABC transporter periplasmic protein LptC [Flavobacteriaceae bacterium XHP0103]|uniref:LPS export ABC transporter periplasmic protein LptC n=1 Tax=Marixanthotalea marina TaxID=2844359 RepID=UPI002989F9CC|nr:LPS export ABC transporter periplasmic protein LptC [Marixanthotalea marina]MBU3821044.1 LPS export ABC transporter periplasmic protein LptC [Marixanthotalea marina]
MPKAVINNIILSVVTVFTVATFFSCEDYFKDVQEIGVSANEPIGVADTINVVYTDSGVVKAILISPKMYDYSNRDFPFYEFTEGVNLELFDEDNNKTTVISDYGISYTKTDLIDLRGNVQIVTHTNDTLLAEQLYYDQKKEWVFTNKPFTYITESDVINGNGFSSDSKFNNVEIFEWGGNITVEE